MRQVIEVRQYPAAVPDSLVAAALADLGDSLEEIGQAQESSEGSRAIISVSPHLLDGVFFGEGEAVCHVPAGERPLDTRWGELLYDLASSAFFPWGSSSSSESIELVGILRISSHESYVAVRKDGVHIFQFPYDSWPSGIHMGAWDGICAYLGESPMGHVHRYADHGWG